VFFGGGKTPTARQATPAWLYWFVGPMPPESVRIVSGRYTVNFRDS
jgi:hypothetical protein